MSIVTRCRSGFTLIELMIVIAIIAILAAILVPNFVRARGQAHLTACKSNVKNIGTACEMFSTNHSGRYPNSLSQLTVGSMGGYLKTIPTCPAVGSDTYTSGYVATTNPDAFTVCCKGTNHAAVEVGTDLPMYDSIQGLIAGGDSVSCSGGITSGSGAGTGSGTTSGSGTGTGSGAGTGSGGSADGYDGDNIDDSEED